MKKWTPLFLLCFVIVLGGCGKDGSLVNPFAEDTSTPPPPTFVAEFPDIPIPREMSEPIVSSNTFVTFTSSGAKCGVQKFSGRVELVSLMNSMRKNMAANGWSLRSLLRSKDSILVFEKPDRMATLVFTDGMVFTDMEIFVSPRLQGDSANLDLSAYSTPGVKSSSDGKQKLSQ